jgi:hypothetical protein
MFLNILIASRIYKFTLKLKSKLHMPYTKPRICYFLDTKLGFILNCNFILRQFSYVILPDSVKKSGTNFLDRFRYTFNKKFAFNKSMMVVPKVDQEFNLSRIPVNETS